VAKESEGDLPEALKYYTEAASSGSKQGVILTMNPAWRGKPITALASESATRLRQRMASRQSVQAEAALLNFEGVSAVNRNDLNDAIEKFSQAFKLDPNNAFSLNNQGYLAEMSGDLETAQEFYRKAQQAGGASARVGLASRPKAEGMPLVGVATQSEGEVTEAMESANAAARRRTGPIQLKRRDNTPVVDPPLPAPPLPDSQR
jgi:tetratricopeptide (TPR) repeat protein